MSLWSTLFKSRQVSLQSISNRIKAVLAHAWSKKLRPLLDNKSWIKFTEILKSQSEVEVTRADEIAILSCVHEGIYDLVQTASHEITFNLPREPSAFFLSPVKFLSFNSSLIITQLFRFHCCSRFRFRRSRSNFALKAAKTNPTARFFFDLRFLSTLTFLKSRSSTKCIYAFFSTSSPIFV